MSSAPVLTGQLIDAPVAGLEFRTPTVQGETGPGGRFTFRDGENIEFSVGDLALGSARAAAEISSRDFVPAAAALTDPEVTNRARFLQTMAAALRAGRLTVAQLRESGPEDGRLRQAGSRLRRRRQRGRPPAGRRGNPADLARRARNSSSGGPSPGS